MKCQFFMVERKVKGGVLKEHLHTREACGIFDVSHMNTWDSVISKELMLQLSQSTEHMTVVDTQASLAPRTRVQARKGQSITPHERKRRNRVFGIVEQQMTAL